MDSSSPTAEVKPRFRHPKKEGAYLWQAKSALKAIADSPAVSNRTCALAVYVSLTFISSDLNAKIRSKAQLEQPFKTTEGLIASKAGLSRRTVMRVLPELEKAGVIRITRQFNKDRKVYEQHTYSLCGFNGKPVTGSHTPHGQAVTPPCDNNDTLPSHNCIREEEPSFKGKVLSSQTESASPLSQEGLLTQPPEKGAPSVAKSPFDSDAWRRKV